MPWRTEASWPCCPPNPHGKYLPLSSLHPPLNFSPQHRAHLRPSRQLWVMIYFACPHPWAVSSWGQDLVCVPCWIPRAQPSAWHGEKPPSTLAE